MVSMFGDGDHVYSTRDLPARLRSIISVIARRGDACVVYGSGPGDTGGCASLHLDTPAGDTGCTTSLPVIDTSSGGTFLAAVPIGNLGERTTMLNLTLGGRAALVLDPYQHDDDGRDVPHWDFHVQQRRAYITSNRLSLTNNCPRVLYEHQTQPGYHGPYGWWMREQAIRRDYIWFDGEFEHTRDPLPLALSAPQPRAQRRW